VLKNGSLRQQGMPQFEEFTPDDIEAIHQYIRQQARTALAAPAKPAAATNSIH